MRDPWRPGVTIHGCAEATGGNADRAAFWIEETALTEMQAARLCHHCGIGYAAKILTGYLTNVMDLNSHMIETGVVVQFVELGAAPEKGDVVKPVRQRDIPFVRPAKFIQREMAGIEIRERAGIVAQKREVAHWTDGHDEPPI
jgi:hypothetical protein